MKVVGKINPYSPPSTMPVRAHDTDVSLSKKFYTPFFTSLLCFGFGVILATIVTLAVAGAIAVVVEADQQFTPVIALFALVGIPSAFGVVICGRIIGAAVLLDDTGIEIKTKRNRKYAWDEISGWQQEPVSGVVSFTANGELVRILNAATYRERNDTIAAYFSVGAGATLGRNNECVSC